MTCTTDAAEFCEPLDARWFEYHCHEGHDSSDAQVWYRSHQQVTVLAHTPSEDVGVTPDTYRVRFADGLEWDVFEDELMDSPADFYRPDPPAPNDPDTVNATDRTGQ